MRLITGKDCRQAPFDGRNLLKLSEADMRNSRDDIAMIFRINDFAQPNSQLANRLPTLNYTAFAQGGPWSSY